VVLKAPEIRVAGVPVRFEPAFFVIILLLGLPQSPEFVVSWVAIATVSILVHEMGHAMAFRAYGLDSRVVLHGFGGLTTAEGVLGPGARVVTSLAGPLSALLLIGVPAWLLEQSGAAPTGAGATVLSQVVWINVGWSLLNLLPVLPLDGGQVFLAICDATTKGRGRRAAEVLSVAVAAVLGVWAYREGFVFAAVLAFGLAAVNLGQLRKVRQDELLDQLDTAHRALLDGDLAAADEVLARVAGARSNGPVRVWCDELLGWRQVLAVDPEDPAAATGPHAEASPVPPPAPAPAPSSSSASRTPATVSTALGAARALAAGRRDEGIALAAWVFAREEAAPPKSLLAAMLARWDVAGAVASELALLGAEGRAGAELLRDLLVHLGCWAAAAEVRDTIP
jgi:Zn-dependent protease